MTCAVNVQSFRYKSQIGKWNVSFSGEKEKKEKEDQKPRKALWLKYTISVGDDKLERSC